MTTSGSQDQHCPDCGINVKGTDLFERYAVCYACGHHFPISADARLTQLVDPGSFHETDRNLLSLDPLSFWDTLPYPQRLTEARAKTGLQDAILAGPATIEGRAMVVVILDFDFMGGSMGSVVGERVARAFEYAREHRLPVLTVSASGGARMQEGMLSLMQMAKTAAAVTCFRKVGLPFISILSHPTTGGVYASYASLGDVILAEPGALIGFAGPRVVEALTGEQSPSNSHSAEFLYQHGTVDRIVRRPDLRRVVACLLKHLCSQEKPSEDVPPPPPPSRAPSSAWKVVQLARHPDRPTSSDYIRRIFTDFIELHGDRLYGDDPAIVGGLASIDGQSVMLLGQERGRGQEASSRHDGISSPEGYRKAQRLMRLAARFGLAIITFIDTPGADVRPQAEERGVALAIATSLSLMSELPVPTIAVATGEGGSGGALALAAGDRLYMLENSIFSVISPEGAAAIIYRDVSKAEYVAERLRLTAHDLKALGIIDGIVAEPP